jgi:hypothetical protein
MKVSDLQQHLADLGRLLGAAKAAGVAAEFTAIGNALAPFQDYGLKEFGAFLVRAEAFSRGEVPVVPPKGGRGGARRTPAAVKEDAAVLVREVARLYEHAGSPDVTMEQIDAATARLASLKNEDLVAVAAGIELKDVRKGMKKDKIIEAIRNRIVQRKGAKQRAGLIDRPEGVSVSDQADV